MSLRTIKAVQSEMLRFVNEMNSRKGVYYLAKNKYILCRHRDRINYIYLVLFMHKSERKKSILLSIVILPSVLSNSSITLFLYSGY